MSEVTSRSIRTLLESIGAPAFGEYWKGQGGILRAYCPGKNGVPDRLLISGEKIGKRLEWGPYGKKIHGADSHIDGRANTDAIIASGLDCPAAKFAVEYEADGHTDFWLPSRRELAIIEASGFVDDLGDDFWSSTQCSATSAWIQVFGDGYVYEWSKSTRAGVLPLRSYVLK